MNARFDPAVLARLRRSGVGLVGGILVSRPLRKVFEQQSVRVTAFVHSGAAVDWSMRHPHAPLFLFDGDQLDDTARIVGELENNVRRGRVGRRPVVLVVTPRLERGLAEVGWSGSTHRVAFIRTEHLLHDVACALADFAGSEPEPPADPVLSSLVTSRVDEARFDVARLGRELEQSLAWLGARWERVQSSWMARVAAPEASDVESTLAVAWLDADGRAFSFRLDGALARAPGVFSARAPQGIWGAIERWREDREVGERHFDDAYTVHADDAGLVEASRVKDLLRRFPGFLDALNWTEDAFCARAESLEREALVPVVEAAARAWHLLVRARLGLVAAPT